MEEESFLLILKRDRPLVFFLKNAKKTSMYDITTLLSHINYTSRKFKQNALIGIRSDLYSLGFSMERLTLFLESIDHRKELITEEVMNILNGKKEDDFLSRKNELEIISCFFE
ncbi:MAG: hypothetical protein OXB84_08415 [Halobacteriovoraceae bacterium]|nr:hypothetical protein [Halobacteriovoraceae bacterium]